MLKSASKVTINTGNVLNLIDVKKKAGQNVSEEVSFIGYSYVCLCASNGHRCKYSLSKDRLFSSFSIIGHPS